MFNAVSIVFYRLFFRSKELSCVELLPVHQHWTGKEPRDRSQELITQKKTECALIRACKSTYFVKYRN